MNEECVVGVYDSLKKAEQAVRILQCGDFPSRQVSLVASGRAGALDLGPQLVLEDDAARDAAIGAGLGSVMGVLAGIAAVTISGAGLVFLAGPVVAALTGATVGAFLGGLAGWGVHRNHIQYYEQCVKDGSVLVIASGNPLETAAAERMLKETDVVEVRLHAKTCSEAPEVAERRALSGGVVADSQRPVEPAAKASTADVPSGARSDDDAVMAATDARERFRRAVEILKDEQAGVKERLLTAYASQLSRINAREDLPPELLQDFYTFRNAISDADMPYGYGERAAKKIHDMDEEQASALARDIVEMFHKLCRSLANEVAAQGAS
jgi:uncharacterized membrane protein